MTSSCHTSTIKQTAILIISCLFFTGCASKYGEQITDVTHYPQCYAPIAELREDEAAYGRTMVTSTAVGTILGMLTGYLATGRVEGAIGGAVAGGTTGAIAGHISASAQEEQKANARMANYMQQLEGDISGLNTITASARMALQCYDREFKTALAEYKANRISRAALDARYAEIKNGTTEVSAILGVTLDVTQQKEEAYWSAIVEEAQRQNTTVSATTASTTTVETASKKAPPKPKGSSAAKSTSKAATQTVTAKAPSAAEKTQLVNMVQQATALKESREEMEELPSDISALQTSWAAELAAIGS